MGFLLHCGAREVPRRDLALVPVPAVQKRFCPVPHDTLADAVQFQLETAGFEPTAAPLAPTADYVRAEVKKWAQVVRETGAKVD